MPSSCKIGCAQQPLHSSPQSGVSTKSAFETTTSKSRLSANHPVSYSLKYARACLQDVKTKNGAIATNSLYVETPEDGTLNSLAQHISYKADGVRMTRQPKDGEILMKVKSVLSRHRFTTMIIDEASFIINSQLYAERRLATQSQMFWAMFMSALDLTEWPTPIVVSGLRSVVDSLVIKDKKDDDQRLRAEAKRRFRTLDLDPGTVEHDEDVLTRAILAYCDIAEVGNILKTEDLIIPRLLHATSGSIGTALELIQDAVALAKSRHHLNKLKREDFALSYELINSAARATNPFRVSDFERVDMRVVAAKSGPEARLRGEEL